MRQYLVTFHKVVPDSTGHDRRIVQERVLVTARSDVSAAFAAKAMFCEAAGIADWRMRADSCEVVALPARRPLQPAAAGLSLSA
ncbi:MAG: hypothetical protein ABW058_03955 [Methylobacterium sp.]